MRKITNYPTKLWAYETPKGQIIPSSIRERSGDSTYALSISFCGKKYGVDNCKKVRITVDKVQ